LRRSGLGSPLPVPYGCKGNPPGKSAAVPEGWTGKAGRYASGADVQAWIDDNGGDNIALRVADGVVGVDVDAYKPVALETLAEFEAAAGLLPPTIVSTSREDSSGIRWYRVEKGLVWPGRMGPGIEVIHPGHRYGMWKGSKHPEGGTYRLDNWRTGENGVEAPKVGPSGSGASPSAEALLCEKPQQGWLRPGSLGTSRHRKCPGVCLRCARASPGWIG
jgi:hypothetical protein